MGGAIQTVGNTNRAQVMAAFDSGRNISCDGEGSTVKRAAGNTGRPLRAAVGMFGDNRENIIVSLAGGGKAGLVDITASGYGDGCGLHAKAYGRNSLENAETAKVRAGVDMADGGTAYAMYGRDGGTGNDPLPLDGLGGNNAVGSDRACAGCSPRARCRTLKNCPSTCPATATPWMSAV